MIGFTSAFFFNFPINRKHVFQHSPKDRLSLKWQIIFYVSLSLFNLVMTGLLMDWIVSSGLLTISLAKICVSAVIATWNFLLFKFFIFSKRPDFTDVEGLIVQ